MREKKFTPGPWIAYNAVNGSDASIMSFGFPEGIPTVCDLTLPVESLGVDSCRASVHLIAAAPLLLEALELWQEAEDYRMQFEKIDEVGWLSRLDAAEVKSQAALAAAYGEVDTQA